MTLAPEARLATLSPRETEIARIIARGLSCRHAAARLGLSVRTIETHMRHIHEKLLTYSRDTLIETYGDALLDHDADLASPPFEPRPAPRTAVGVFPLVSPRESVPA